MSHVCPSCGASVREGVAFCTNCGQRVDEPRARPSSRDDSSIVGSLANLGLRIGKRQLIGYGVAILAGLVVPRVAPYLFPIIVYPALSPFLDTPGLDTVNTAAMNTLTCLTSYSIAFVVTMMFRRM